jgi:hypothetical protein
LLGIAEKECNMADLNLVIIDGTVVNDPRVDGDAMSFAIKNKSGWGDRTSEQEFNCYYRKQNLGKIKELVQKETRVTIQGEMKAGKSGPYINVKDIFLRGGSKKFTGSSGGQKSGGSEEIPF